MPCFVPVPSIAWGVGQTTIAGRCELLPNWSTIVLIPSGKTEVVVAKVIIELTSCTLSLCVFLYLGGGGEGAF